MTMDGVPAFFEKNSGRGKVEEALEFQRFKPHRSAAGGGKKGVVLTPEAISLEFEDQRETPMATRIDVNLLTKDTLT